MSGLARFRHIAVEGAIGAGKTTLARLLAGRLGAELLLEQPAENPFLGRYYDDMPGYAFQTQLFFLFQRQKQMQAVAQPSMFESALVSDFMFAKDTVFARMTLSDDEYRLYAQMYAPIAAQVREPDLVVWLQASPQTLLQRVHRRGVAMEQGIDAAYLQRLCDAYADYFDTYDAAPVFSVDTERFDPSTRADDAEALLEELSRFDAPRGSYPEPFEASLRSMRPARA